MHAQAARSLLFEAYVSLRDAGTAVPEKLEDKLMLLHTCAASRPRRRVIHL